VELRLRQQQRTRLYKNAVYVFLMPVANDTRARSTELPSGVI